MAVEKKFISEGVRKARVEKDLSKESSVQDTAVWILPVHPLAHR